MISGQYCTRRKPLAGSPISLFGVQVRSNSTSCSDVHHDVQAASGVGEPFASAAGILGGMLVWRTFYTGFLDWNFFLSYDASSNPTPQDDTKAWWETMAILAVLVMLCASAAALAGYSVNGASTMSLLRIVHSRM